LHLITHIRAVLRAYGQVVARQVISGSLGRFYPAF